MKLTSELANKIGRDKKQTEALLQALAQAIGQHCSDGDTVAIPGLGNFQTEKHDEEIITDLTTGRRMLLPPEIRLTFRAAGKLRKLL